MTVSSGSAEAKFGVILPRAHAAVASGHHDELPDRSRLHGIDHLVGQRQHLMVGEAADDLSVFDLRRRRALLGVLDQLREILRPALLAVRDMRCAGQPGRARRIDPVGVGRVRPRGYDAVGREENHAVESLEFVALFPPGVAVVADEVAVLLESRIIVRRKHFAVGVDVHAGVFGLFEQLLEVFQVMTAHEDAGAFADADVDLRDLWAP